MSIKLKRVELANIRTHKHIVFTPEDDGITAISGPNGSGKSTIVDSIVWALYGTKPAGVSKTAAIYRTGAVFGTDKCFAKIDIEVDRRELRIERRMVNKTGTVECDVWEAEEDDAGDKHYKHVAGPAVSHTESYIRQFMKMDERGFLAAILVQQKQVDNLISSTPRERAQVIEKLTGISSISKALESARNENNILKKLAAKAEVNEDSFNELKKFKETAEKDYETSSELYEKFEKEVSLTNETHLNLKNEVDIETRKIEAVENWKNKVTELDARITAQEESLTSIIAEKDEKKSQMSRIGGAASLDDLEPKMRQLKNNLRKLETDKNYGDQELEQRKQDLLHAQELIEKSSIKTLEEAVTGLKRSQHQVSVLESKLENSRAVVMSSDSERNKLDKAINVLSKGHGTCPTCLQHVEDVSAAVETLEKQKNEIQIAKEAEQENISNIQSKISQSRIIVEKFEELIEALENDEKLAAVIKESTTMMEKLSSDIKIAETELEAFEKVYQAARRQSETKREYDQLLARAQKISNDVDTMIHNRNTASEKIKSSGALSPNALNKLRKKLDEAYESWAKSNSSFTDAKVSLARNTETFKNLTEKVEAYGKELERHRGLLEEVEIATTTTKVIEEYRENRIANSVPVIEVHASELLSRFTEGMFTRLKLDSKFSASVVRADGTECPVGLLSGGELSAAAIALRLSISMLLNSGDSENLIILDEVLVSQDDNRAEIILSTIKDVCKGQVVLVAHNSITDGISDKVVELSGT